MLHNYTYAKYSSLGERAVVTHVPFQFTNAKDFATEYLQSEVEMLATGSSRSNYLGEMQQIFPGCVEGIWVMLR